MPVACYQLLPVLSNRKKSANARSGSRLSPYNLAENETQQISELNLRAPSAPKSRVTSVKYSEIRLKYDHEINTDTEFNKKFHMKKLSILKNDNSKTQSKLTDVKKEYYERLAYNQLKGSNKKNFKKQHYFLNVYSVVNKKNIEQGKFNLFELDDKFYVKPVDDDDFKYNQPVASVSTKSDPVVHCNHIFDSNDQFCLNCKQTFDRLSIKKRVSAKTHIFSNKKLESDLERQLTSKSRCQDIILPVNFLRSLRNDLTNTSYKKVNSDLIKNTTVSELFEFDYEIKPDLSLWTVA